MLECHGFPVTHIDYSDLARGSRVIRVGDFKSRVHGCQVGGLPVVHIDRLDLPAAPQLHPVAAGLPRLFPVEHCESHRWDLVGERYRAQGLRVGVCREATGHISGYLFALDGNRLGAMSIPSRRG